MAGRRDDPAAAAAATAQIDAYLAALSPDKRASLQDLRETIAAAAPEAVEAISYGMPAFRYRGRPLVSYLAAKAHCSFFPMSSEVLDAHRAQLEGFSMSKGTIRFTPDHPIPKALVETIVHARMAKIEAAGSLSPGRRGTVGRVVRGAP
jgi:uncharacterized protein YdhG (YjbR/CyaY superfamily)